MQEQGQQFLTVRQVADLLSKTEQRVRQVAAAGGFEGAFKWGRDWAIPAASVEEYRKTAKQRRSKRKRGQVEG